MVKKSGVQQSRLVVCPIIYRVLFIPGGAGFLPPTVFCKYTLENERLDCKNDGLEDESYFNDGDFRCRCYLLCVYILYHIYTHFFRYIFTKVLSTRAN